MLWTLQRSSHKRYAMGTTKTMSQKICYGHSKDPITTNMLFTNYKPWTLQRPCHKIFAATHILLFPQGVWNLVRCTKFRGKSNANYLFKKKHKNTCSTINLVGFVALRPKSTGMVIAGRSVHLTTLFPGQA